MCSIQNLLNESFKAHFFNRLPIILTPQQKNITLVTTAALSAFALVLSIRRLCCFKKQQGNKDSTIDSLDSKKTKRYLAKPLIKDDGHNFLYLKEKDVVCGGFIGSSGKSVHRNRKYKAMFKGVRQNCLNHKGPFLRFES